MMESSQVVLSVKEALERYREELCQYDQKGRLVVLPGVIGTVFFRGGSKPEVRQGILACFDRFATLSGVELKGGRGPEGTGRFGRRTPAGAEAIRRAIAGTSPYEQLEAVRSSEASPDAAAAYQIKTLTTMTLPYDYQIPGTEVLVKKDTDTGMSYLKFWMPMDFVSTPEGVQEYEAFLQFVCNTLPVCGGYGGLSPILPYNFHEYMPQEWELAKRFSGLEIDSHAFTQADEYEAMSYEGESDRKTAIYGYLHPGAKVRLYGFIKGVNWYTIIDELFIDRLGGEEAIRAALARPDIHIGRIKDCLLVRAGDFPRLGAPEEGLPEPYVFVNRILRVLRNPRPDSLHSNIPGASCADVGNTLAWEARFDLPDAPPIPRPPKIVPLTQRIVRGPAEEA